MILAALSFVLFFWQFPATASILPKDFQEFPCAKSMDQTVQGWGSLGQWQKHLSAKGQIELWSPSNAIGSWIQIEKTREGKLHARKLSPSIMLEALWLQNNCLPAIAPTPLSRKIVANEFNDMHLKKLVDEKKTGIIYLWSPQMPLSIQGVNNIIKATKQQQLNLTVLLDSNADLAQAKKMQEENKWPTSFLARANSLELEMRNAFIHFPNLLFYSHQKMQMEIAPGLKTIKNYQALLQEHFRQEKQ